MTLDISQRYAENTMKRWVVHLTGYRLDGMPGHDLQHIEARDVSRAATAAKEATTLATVKIASVRLARGGTDMAASQ